MGLFNGIKKQLLKVIEWNDNTQNTLAYRYPMTDRDEIMNGCQLIVRESQSAILVCQGQVADVYGPGRHRLETGNMPILTKIMSWAYNFNSPFKAEVYYVSTKTFFNQKWGTSNPVMMRDKEFGVVRLRGYGKFNYKVSDPVKFLKNIFGTNKSFQTEQLQEEFKSLIVTAFSDSIAESGISALDLAANYKEFGSYITKQSKEEFDVYGMEILQVLIENISLPEEVEKMLDTRTQMGVLKDEMGTFTQFQAAQAIRDAAQNGNGMAGMGVGLGAGVTMGQVFTQAMSQTQNAQPQQAAPVAAAAAATTAATAQPEQPTKLCPNCGKPVPANAKFCLECGQKLDAENVCPDCGEKLAPGAKFCPNCGKKLI